jgi:hypothetical protein
MKRKMDKHFWIIIVDHDNKTFNVRGPSYDDTYETNRTVDLQNDGRHINCISCPDNQTKEAVISKYRQQIGYAYSEESIL